MSDIPSNVGFVAPLASDLAPFFPGYEFEGLIASGGMGAVYAAVQKSLDRTVAIKILPPELSKDEAFRTGFEAEAKAMARLNHSNLIGVYDFGEVNGMLFITMEYVPGQSIYHSATGIAIDPQEVIRLVSSVCDGLAHAHDNGILHRDIKPANILLDLHAQPKIGDFGLARPIGRKIEEGEEIFGTPHYTAPEVVESPHSVDNRADIFSVGVLLHELLTGKLPADDLRPASQICHCSPLFDAIIVRATHPSPAGRYVSANQLSAALRAINYAPAPAAVTPAVATPVAAAVAGPRTARPKAYRPALPKKRSVGLMPLVNLTLLAGACYFAYIKFINPKASPIKIPSIQIPIEFKNSESEQTKATAPKDTESPEIPVFNVPKASENSQESTPPPVEVVPETPTEDTQKSTTIAPKSDVQAFFAKARKVMQDKAAPTLSLHKKNSVPNFKAFEEALKAHITKTRHNPTIWEKKFKPVLAELRLKSFALPENVNTELSGVANIEEISAPFLEKQKGYDVTLDKSISELRDTYLHGLGLHRERLVKEDDVGADLLVKEEMDRTKDDPLYFRDLMLTTP